VTNYDQHFDSLTIGKLKFYVYALIKPITNVPFYVGKGKGNRVFEHIESDGVNTSSKLKYETIREIRAAGNKVKHIIIRHGLTEKAAFELESAIIDFTEFIGIDLSNLVLGHDSLDKGIMTTNELIRKYNAKQLNQLKHPVIIININRNYDRAKGPTAIYEATKASWVVSQKRIENIKYALSEYKGIIVAVFRIDEWYPIEVTDRNGKTKTRWGFNGIQAENAVRNCYLNKTIAHIKKRGAANPIRYRL